MKRKDIKPQDIILELGCGSCHFAKFLKKGMLDNYIGLDISDNMLSISDGSPKKIQADMMELPFLDNAIKYVVSIYNLEHLQEIERALNEVNRVLRMDGEFIFTIPMEGGLFYNLGRRFTSQRLVEKKYKVDYTKIIRWEHPNIAIKIIKLVSKKFVITDRFYFPFLLPSVDLNLFAVFKAVKK